MSFNWSLFHYLIFISLQIVTPLSIAQGKRIPIFRDDYGDFLYTEDCPKDKSQLPVLKESKQNWHSVMSLSCLAPYPITLEFEGLKPSNPTVKLKLVQATPQNNTNACYIISLSSYAYFSDASPVGNYVCRSLIDPTKVSSTYVFSKAENWHRQTPFLVKSNYEVYINSNNISKLNIPCLASKDTGWNATLNKLDKETHEQVDVFETYHWNVTYDQKKGFDVTFPGERDENSTDVEGTYFCKPQFELNAEAEINVKHADFIAFPNRTNLTFNQGELILECYSGEPVTLKILSVNSDSKSELQQAKIEIDKDIPQKYKDAGYFHHARTIFKTEDPKVKGDIACVNASGGQLFVWHFDNEYTCKCRWNSTQNNPDQYYHQQYDRFGNPIVQTNEYGESLPDPSSNYASNDWTFYDQPYGRGEITCYNDKATMVDINFFPCKNPVECQMTSVCLEGHCPNIGSIFYREDRLVTNSTTKYFDLQTGLLQCSADGFITVFKATTALDMNLYLNQEKTDNVLKIRAGETSLYTGDKMIFSCTAITFSLIDQIVWAFEYKNGSFSYPEFKTSSNDWRRYRPDDQMINGMLGSVRTSYLTTPSSDATKLWCFAPKWNTTEWAKTSVELKIYDASPAEDPPICPSSGSLFIVMARNTSRSYRQRVNLPHVVDGKDITVHDPIQTVSLYCLARFPIQWVKDGVNISNTKSSRANCKKDRNGDVLKQKLYKITITFAVAALNSTGNYTCRTTIPYQSRQSSVYIYAREFENRTTFVNEGHHYQVVHKYDNYSSSFNKWAVLPCRLNHPDAPPYLFIDHPEQETVERVPFDNNILKFDPKIGFSIDVTNRRVIKNERTIFVCSDHKDGSFIGNLVTLQLQYDKNSTIVVTTAPPTKNPSGSSTDKPTTNNPLHPLTTTPPKSQNPVVVSHSSNDSGSAGLIVSIVLLTSLCCACLAVIYHLYQKLTNQQKSNPPPQELDWTNATNHTSGNNIENLIDANNYNVNEIIEPMPSLSEIAINYKNI